MKILLLGFSVRALAEQINLAGHTVYGIDAFADRDFDYINQYNKNNGGPSLTCFSTEELGLDYSPYALIKAIDELNVYFDALAYTSNLDNYPGVLGEIVGDYNPLNLPGMDSPLDLTKEEDIYFLGNNPLVLRKFKSSLYGSLYDLLDRNSILFPEIYLPGDYKKGSTQLKSCQLLKKPFLGGGGVGISRVNKIDFENPKFYFQEYIPGTTGSALFVANGESVKMLGVTEQLKGSDFNGLPEFLYCGNITVNPSLGVLKRLEFIATLLTKNFNLKGLNGFDFIYWNNNIYFLELNPRFTAAMELFSYKEGWNLFQFHLKASLGKIPEFSTSYKDYHWGKKIIYAPYSLKISANLNEILEWKHFADIDPVRELEPFLRDLPHQGEIIEKHAPLTTVIANGTSKKLIMDKFISTEERLLKECTTTV